MKEQLGNKGWNSDENPFYGEPPPAHKNPP
jgi:hypothetical protein